MSKQRSQVADYSLYVVMRIAIAIAQALPFWLACHIADLMAWLAYQIDKRHREVALDNLRHAFPGQYTDAELDGMVRACYRHFCVMLMEILFLPRLINLNNWRECLLFRTHGEAVRMLDLLLNDRPVLMATGHFGNWEVSSYVLGLLGVKFHGIARPIDNPYVDEWLRGFREAQGQKILAKKGDFEQIQSVLSAGGVLGTLADQDAGQRGLFVDFLNRPASTHKALALLAIEHNVPIAVVAAARLDKPLKYLGMVEDVIYPEEYAGRPDAVRAITQRYTTALERMVCQFPEQYFWLHRRWKHQPPVKKRAA